MANNRLVTTDLTEQTPPRLMDPNGARAEGSPINLTPEENNQRDEDTHRYTLPRPSTRNEPRAGSSRESSPPTNTPPPPPPGLAAFMQQLPFPFSAASTFMTTNFPPVLPPPSLPSTNSANSSDSQTPPNQNIPSLAQQQPWSAETVEQYRQYSQTLRDSSLNSSSSPEEQFKQLYEITSEPERKEFLDDLFEFMANKGTPINRLPIMAKAVLDLFELYKLVIQRGGLVEVINKKLWQEIIKGLHLPSSITSAAFTLRTQYMKYLYSYEYDKERLSTPDELQMAIDGNRREGRRGSHGSFLELNHHNSQRSQQLVQLAPMSLVTAARTNGATALHSALASNHLGHMQGLGLAAIPPAEFEARLAEYAKLLNRDMRPPTTNPPHQRQASPPSASPPNQPTTSYDFNRNLWTLCPNQSEPQREPINLETREHREQAGPVTPRRHHRPDPYNTRRTGSSHTRISNRNEAAPVNSLVVSVEVNGVRYSGTLFAQTSSTQNHFQLS